MGRLYKFIGKRSLVVLSMLMIAQIAWADQDEASGPPIDLFDAPSGESSLNSEELYLGDRDNVSADGQNSEQEIVVDTLDRADPASIGLLSYDNGGFGIEMWSDTSRSVVRTLLSLLPVGTSSRVMQDLARRLLLSEAQMPSDDESIKDILQIRFEKLAAAGETDAILRLVRIVPIDAISPTIELITADALYLTGDYSGACARSENAVGRSGDPYWLKSVAFCRALHEEKEAEAWLAVGLLRELDSNRDQVFNALFSALVDGRDVSVKSLPEPSGLHLAMLRAANIPIPSDALENASPATLKSIAIAPNASESLRVDAATRAEVLGAIDSKSVRRIFANVVFKPDAHRSVEALYQPEEVYSLDSMVDAIFQPITPALLYQHGEAQTDLNELTQSLRLTLDVGRYREQYNSFARTNLLAALRLIPRSEPKDLAPEMVRSLLTAGATTAAMQWFEFLSETDADVLRPIIHFAAWQDQQILEDKSILRWWKVMSNREQRIQKTYGETLFALLQGLDIEVPDEKWIDLIAMKFPKKGTMPSASVWRNLTRAVDDGKVGETVALVLIALGDEGLAEVHPMVLSKAVNALNRIGLTAEAYALALEAALAKGL